LFWCPFCILHVCLGAPLHAFLMLFLLLPIKKKIVKFGAQFTGMFTKSLLRYRLGFICSKLGLFDIYVACWLLIYFSIYIIQHVR